LLGKQTNGTQKKHSSLGLYGAHHPNTPQEFPLCLASADFDRFGEKMCPQNHLFNWHCRFPTVAQLVERLIRKDKRAIILKSSDML
jgi:hypothetical protein